jgi:hypothetical protein
MELKNLTKVRRFALGAVAVNLVAVAATAWLLPRELQVLLPLVALVLPLLSTAAVEAAAEHNHVAV